MMLWSEAGGWFLNSFLRIYQLTDESSVFSCFNFPTISWKFPVEISWSTSVPQWVIAVFQDIAQLKDAVLFVIDCSTPNSLKPLKAGGRCLVADPWTNSLFFNQIETEIFWKKLFGVWILVGMSFVSTEFDLTWFIYHMAFYFSRHVPYSDFHVPRSIGGRRRPTKEALATAAGVLKTKVITAPDPWAESQSWLKTTR